jgi:serine/threonine-protein kinase
MDAFARAIALDPGFAPAYEHVPGLLVRLGRLEEAKRNAQVHLTLDPISAKSETRLAALLLDPSSRGSPEVERHLDTASVSTLFGATFNTLAFWPDTAETGVWLMRRLAEPGRSAGGNAPWVLDPLMWPQYLAYVLAFRGHLREALEVNQRLTMDPGATPYSVGFDTFLDLSLLGLVPDSLAGRMFRPTFDPAVDGGLATPRHLRGLPWWLARRDTTSLARLVDRAGRVARSPGAPRARLRARLVGEMSGAYLSLARGDSADALRRLTAIPDTLCLVDGFASNCFHVNLTLAGLLVARGEDRRAFELLDRWRWSEGSTPFFVLATLELGRIAERLGNRRKAA